MYLPPPVAAASVGTVWKFVTNWEFIAPWITLTILIVYKIYCWGMGGRLYVPDWSSWSHLVWEDFFFAAVAALVHASFVATRLISNGDPNGLFQRTATVGWLTVVFGLPLGTVLGMSSMRLRVEADNFPKGSNERAHHDELLEALNVGLWTVTGAMTVIAGASAVAIAVR